MDPVTPQNSAAKQDQIASGSPWQPAFPHSVGDFQWADSRRAAQMRKSAALVMPPGSTSAPAMVACSIPYTRGCWGNIKWQSLGPAASTSNSTKGTPLKTGLIVVFVVCACTDSSTVLHKIPGMESLSPVS